MPKLFCMLLLLLFKALTLTAQHQQVKYSKAVEDRIHLVEKSLAGWVQVADGDKWNLQDRMSFHKIHGVSVAVIHNYQLEWARGYGFADTADKRRVTSNTLFQAASISKSINAVGVLLLADKKKIALDKDINTYLKSWKFPIDSLSKNKPVTVGNLLSHSAGLGVHGFPGYQWTDSLPSDNQILDGLRPANTAAVRSRFEPGLRVQYSGGGTTITEKIVMDISGQEYEVYMQKQVLQPLGMNGSFYSQPPPPGAFAQLATAYHANGKPVKGKFHIYPEQAAAGLWTNPTDLAKYIIETQLSLLGRSNKVLSKEMTLTMLTPYVDKAAAMGVFIETKGNEKYFSHGGANEGFRCHYYGSLENGNGIIVMVNSNNGNIIPEIINSVSKVYGWKDFYKPQIKKVVLVNSSILSTYTGDYLFPQGTLSVSMKDKDLYISQNGNPPVKMYFTSDTDFFIMEIPADIQFQKDEQGKVGELLIKQGGGEFKAKRK